MKYIVIALIVLGVLLSLGISLASTPRLHFYENPDMMEQEILRVIPPGTPIADAKKIMERNWFKCEYYENNMVRRIREVSATSEPESTYFGRVDTLLCKRSKGFIVTQDWIVDIVHKNNQVTIVIVNYGLTGP
ncbi:hypothetical protein NOS3756_59710 (plasmid) [Nostoc sp. NIES-3756]|uniref:hypothetical protein n=1 Tax=Nostoc sp. NIES-3756 TaxID=1751286 RepID=UPI00071F8E50|nr:hypothetical protein [Nostoc sp. NIES-3756]BAT56959.1 hypothetical protein NOS3756_59710 [Nostoc sp. NIES-3756]